MVRKARQEEAKRVLFLISLAYAKAFYKLAPLNSVEEILQFLEPIYKESNNRLSFENMLVYELEGELAGAICIYDGKDASKLDERFNQFLPKPLEAETPEHFFYIDALAVDEKYRRKGIAARLIEAAFDEAAKKGKDLSLLVDQDNKIARKSYEKIGFKPYSHLFFNKKPYFRMVKYLDLNSSC